MCPKIPITSDDDNHKEDKTHEKTANGVPESGDAAQAAPAAGSGEQSPGPDPAATAQAARAYGATAAAASTDSLPDLESLPGGRPEGQLPPGDKAAEYLDMLQRMKADFENFKKRSRKEKSDTIRFANEDLLRKTLPIVDNLDRGLGFARAQGMATDMLKGFEMVEKQLLDLLADYGVTPFESLNATFDPNVHEPMTMLERDDVDENTVIEELERGYMIHDRVLRVARVIVSRKPAGEDPAPGAGDDAGGGA